MTEHKDEDVAVSTTTGSNDTNNTNNESTNKVSMTEKAKNFVSRMKEDRGTMKGMIQTSNQVLDRALDETNFNKWSAGLSQSMFDSVVGVVIMSIAQVGIGAYGSVGTGVMLKRTNAADAGTSTWSKPSACGYTSVGWGLVFPGASVRESIVFVLTESAFESLTAENGLKVGAQGTAALGSMGRAAQADAQVSGRGYGPTYAVSFNSKGFFLGASIEVGVVGARNQTNQSFYGREVHPRDILLRDDVTIPTDAPTDELNQVYDKLNQLLNSKKEAATMGATANATTNSGTSETDILVEPQGK